MKLGLITSSSRFSQVRYFRLKKALSSFNLEVDWFNPFGVYDQIVIESVAVASLLPVIQKHKARGTRIILYLTEVLCPISDIFDAVIHHEAKDFEFNGVKAFYVEEGVEYNPIFKKPSKGLRNLVWFGSTTDVGALQTVQPFLKEMMERGARLTLLVDDPTVAIEGIPLEIKPFSDDVTGFDMAILPCGSPWSVKTAWLRNLPLLYVDRTGLFKRVGKTEPKFQFCRGVENETDWLDYFELHEMSWDNFQAFRSDARQWVITNSLIQSQCIKWLEVFEFCNTKQHM